MQGKRRKTLERFVNGAVWEQQGKLIEAPKGWQREWVGLPEYAQLSVEPYALVHVRFATAGDLAEFSKLIGQRVVRTTKAIWYPEIVRGIHSQHEWVSEKRSEPAVGLVPQGTEASAEGFVKRGRKQIGQQQLFKEGA